MFLNFVWLWFKACCMMPLRLIAALPSEGLLPFIKRLLLFPLLFATFILLNLLHLLGFILDELLFHNYRKVEVKRPVFITGIPRSGTTHLQRVLAHDEQFTTLRTWEVLFAPSITERYLFRLIGRLLSPLAFIAKPVRKALFGAMDNVHLFGLLEAEEDFFLFLWIDCCFLMAFLCPESKHYWSLGSFSTDVSKPMQKQIMTYYRQCLQKHLYFHGEHLTLLSKNPSFTSLIPVLHNTFQDSRFIFCVREPVKALPSQLSSLRPAMTILGKGMLNNLSQEKLLLILHGYYAKLNTLGKDNSIYILPMNKLQHGIHPAVENIYQQLQLSLNTPFAAHLNALQSETRQYKTTHRYSLEDFGLDENTVRQRFADVWSDNITSENSRPERT